MISGPVVRISINHGGREVVFRQLVSNTNTKTNSDWNPNLFSIVYLKQFNLSYSFEFLLFTQSQAINCSAISNLDNPGS